jgi:hypothetical protein
MTPLPDSGTAANMQAISTGRIASHAGVGAVSGIATNLFSGDPALSLATTVAVPFLSYGADAAIRGAKNKTLMSRLYQGWQGNQLIPERGSAVAGGAKQVLLSGPRVTYEGSQANPIDMSGQTDQAAVRQMLDERVKNSGGRTIWFKNPDGRVLPYR